MSKTIVHVPQIGVVELTVISPANTEGFVAFSDNPEHLSAAGGSHDEAISEFRRVNLVKLFSDNSEMNTRIRERTERNLNLILDNSNKLMLKLDKSKAAYEESQKLLESAAKMFEEHNFPESLKIVIEAERIALDFVTAEKLIIKNKPGLKIVNKNLENGNG